MCSLFPKYTSTFRRQFPSRVVELMNTQLLIDKNVTKLKFPYTTAQPIDGHPVGNMQNVISNDPHYQKQWIIQIIVMTVDDHVIGNVGPIQSRCSELLHYRRVEVEYLFHRVSSAIAGCFRSSKSKTRQYIRQRTV